MTGTGLSQACGNRNRAHDFWHFDELALDQTMSGSDRTVEVLTSEIGLETARVGFGDSGVEAATG